MKPRPAKQKMCALHFSAIVIAFCVILANSSGCGVASTGDNLQGKRFFNQGNFNGALTSFQQALRRDPTNADAYYNIGAVYQQFAKQTRNLQWQNQAEQYFRNAIQLNAQHVEAHRALAVLLVDTNRQSQAFDLLRTWQARSPTSSEPMIELARLHEEFGDQQRAVQFLADAISMDGQNPRAHKALGVLREKQGQYHLALDNYIRSYQANNMQPDIATKIANLQTRLRTAGIPQSQFQAQQQQGISRQPGTAQQYVPR
jgi:tetratricopeptide (TPR) repeat protein